MQRFSLVTCLLLTVSSLAVTTMAATAGEGAAFTGCVKVQPHSWDIVRRVCAVLPYMDREHANAVFLRKFRGALLQLSDSRDPLDREAAAHAAMLLPLTMLRPPRDLWCLLERWLRALRLFAASHPRDKRSALKLLQHTRPLNLKVQSFISELPQSAQPMLRSPSAAAVGGEDDAPEPDKKDIHYIKELIKNLG